jgi:exonuclease SbcC
VDSTKKSDDALIASLGEQIQAETKRKTELSSQYDDLTNTIAGYRTDIEQHNEQIHSKETEIHGMLHTAGIEQNIEMTLDALNKFKDQLSEARNSISGEEKQIEARKEALENQKTKAQSLTGRSVCPTCEQEVDPEHIKNHIIEIDFKIAEHNTQMVEVHAEMDVNKRHTDCIVSAISKYDEITGLKTSINTLDTKIESSTATLDGLKRSVDTSNDQLLILNIKKENLANKLEDTDIKLGEMHDRIQQLSDEYDGHKQVHEQSKNILDSLIEDKSRESVINAEIDGLNKQIESLKKIIEQNSKKIETIQSNIVKKTEEINSLTNQKSELDKQMQREDSTHLAKKQEYEIVKTIKKNLQDISSFKSDINNLNEQADIKRQSVTIVGNQISDNKKHIQKIDEKLEGINVDEDRDKLKKFNDASASYEKLINDVNEKNNNIQQKIGNIQTNIVEMNELSDELNVLKNKKDYLMTIAEDVDILDMTYTQTRTEIRARNINTLNSYVNEMFNLMSIDNAYSHVLLDNDYNIQVFQKDGTALDPKQLSGGERAILNIVFRCAIYRLLAHGFSSESSEALPPIVMDEPTTFLDREHVKQLIQLLDTMKSLGVNQIIVVTHDDTLIDAADTVYRVEKDSTTNISKMHRTAETKLGFVL